MPRKRTSKRSDQDEPTQPAHDDTPDPASATDALNDAHVSGYKQALAEVYERIGDLWKQGGHVPYPKETMDWIKEKAFGIKPKIVGPAGEALPRVEGDDA